MNPVQLSDIKKILILGCGTLGLRVALQCAISGFQTYIYDISESGLVTAKKNQEKILRSLIKNERIAKSEFNIIMQRLNYSTNAEEAAKDADFVNESVTENVEIKKQVWKKIGHLCPEHTVFTTNSSFLLPSQFSEDSGNPKRFCAFHFHDVFFAKVVDIMPHKGTEPWVTELLYDLGIKLNQIPVHIKNETSGYLFNFMLMSILTSAGSLFANGAGTIQDIDRSFMGNFKLPFGPFGMIDQVGLDTALHITNNKGQQGYAFAAVLQPLVNQGKLGIKSGEGFYKYPNPEYSQSDFLLPN
jgi:3-hydroxybutyryl-CoA dehydrogenase